jgi:Cu/Ag efflux pump CusA
LKSRGRREERSERRPRITISAGVLGGLGSMLLGGIWFAVRWADGFISLYAVVLFFFGFVAVVNGLLGRPEE